MPITPTHTLADAAVFVGGRLSRFRDDGDFGAWGHKYPPHELAALSLPPHPTADFYVVGYGVLNACEDDGTQWGKSLAQLDPITRTWA